MRWPFVSRDAFEIALASERRRADAEHENAMALRRELSNLTARYHMLRLRGGETSEPGQPVAPKPPRDIVAEAIATACRGDEALRRMMALGAQHDRIAGLKDEEIVARIHRGHRPMDEYDEQANAAPDVSHGDSTTDPGVTASAA